MDVKAIRASDVPPEPTRWLWKGWLPLRNLSLLAGLPGLGKTTFAVQLAAEVTQGTLEGALHGQPADVLIASLEDAIAATLVPRFMAANADLTRVHFVACEKPGSVLDLTAHLPQIDRLAQELDVRLLVVDPLVATLPAAKMSSHKDQDVRSCSRRWRTWLNSATWGRSGSCTSASRPPMPCSVSGARLGSWVPPGRCSSSVPTRRTSAAKMALPGLSLTASATSGVASSPGPVGSNHG
jgi:AAA domain